jgi:hypothetical protein
MFSLCSNSIESRFRSILWGNFLVNSRCDLNTEKAKAKATAKMDSLRS